MTSLCSVELLCFVLRSACLPVYTSVCATVRSHASKNYASILQQIKIFVRVAVALARSFSDDSATRYVLPVLWMTSCMHEMSRQRLGEANRT